MDDLISRQTAIDAAKRLSLGETDATRLAMRIGDYLERLPSAQPHWIPCSERLPTEDGEYITTVEDGEGMFVTSNDWRQDLKQWGFWSVDEEYDEVWRRVTNVVAWMELPEPWRAES